MIVEKSYQDIKNLTFAPHKIIKFKIIADNFDDKSP